MLLTSLLVPLLVATCHAEYYHIVGTDFNDYLGNSNFHVEPYYEVSQYGLPPPPGGDQSYALYLTDLSFHSMTSVISVPSSGLVTFKFVFFCDGSGSELDMRLSYPWEVDAINLCGPNSSIDQPGQWVTATFTRACVATCSNLQLWLAGESNANGKITGLYSLSITTDGATFPPTAGTTVTTEPTTQQTTTTTTMPTTTTTASTTTKIPTTTTPTTTMPTTTATPTTTTTTIPTTTTTPTTAMPTTTTPTTSMPTTTTPTTTTPVTTYTTTASTTTPITTQSTTMTSTTTPTTSTTTPTTSTITTTEDATTAEPMRYVGPFDNIWGSSQCGTAGVGEDKSVSECMDQCDETPGCTAFNYREKKSDCILRSCPLPVPPPESYNSAYQGYAKASNLYSGLYEPHPVRSKPLSLKGIRK